MAESNLDFKSTSGAVEAVNARGGMFGKGQHINGGSGAETDTSNVLVKGLIKTDFDSEVVKMGWSSAPINAMTRDMGYKPTKAMEYGYYSVDIRDCEDYVKTAISITAVRAISGAFGTTAPTVVPVEVNKEAKFDVTDIIIFDGIEGKNGVTLAGRVASKFTDSADSNKIKLNVQLLNGVEPDAGNGNFIPANTKVYILGHAAAETDAKTTPYAALPEKRTQFMQKFMVQSLISSVMIESDKEVNWGKSDINEILMQQFIEDIEKTYIWGVKSYTFDTTTRMYTRTTSGIVEQLLEAGQAIYPLGTYANGVCTVTRADIVDFVSDVFDKNSGSIRRYLFMGTNFANKFFTVDEDNTWISANETVRKFEFDFSQLKLFGNVIMATVHPLFSKLGWSDYALVLDRQYVERRVFRSMDETALELQKTGAYDGESSVWSEISSVIVKYPNCHKIVKLANA